MACGRDDQGRVDGVGVHAGLVIVVLRDEGPVCDHACDTDRGTVRTRDEVFDGGRVEQFDVRGGEDAGEEGGGEEGLLNQVSVHYASFD